MKRQTALRHSIVTGRKPFFLALPLTAALASFSFRHIKSLLYSVPICGTFDFPSVSGGRGHNNLVPHFTIRRGTIPRARDLHLHFPVLGLRTIYPQPLVLQNAGFAFRPRGVMRPSGSAANMAAPTLAPITPGNNKHAAVPPASCSFRHGTGLGPAVDSQGADNRAAARRV